MQRFFKKERESEREGWLAKKIYFPSLILPPRLSPSLKCRPAQLLSTVGPHQELPAPPFPAVSKYKHIFISFNLKSKLYLIAARVTT